MRKYGVENFQIELLEETNIPEEREVFWIEQKGSFKNGYNATLGGDGKHYLDYDLIVSTYKEIQNISKTAEILKCSVDSVKMVLDSRKIPIKSSSQISAETNGKIIKMYYEKEYICSFPSLKAAARYLIDNNLTKSNIERGIAVHLRKCANGERKTAYNREWKWEENK